MEQKAGGGERRAFFEQLAACTPARDCPRGLMRITELMHRLGDPQESLRFLHITGTNGKGSTAAMLASVLQQAGYTVGLFTSPHLRSYRERMQINGAEISDGDLDRLAEQLRPAAEGMDVRPTEFEWLTAMGLLYFAQQKCDVVVLEVGRGGRRDATNVIPAPELAVIAHIGLEHTEYLGDTLEKIAGEKAGIIKPGAAVALSGQSAGVEQVIRTQCARCGNELLVTDETQLTAVSRDLSGQRFHYRGRRNLRLRLAGGYQLQNAALALDAIDLLRRRGWRISEENIAQGLAAAEWPGRFEILSREPLVILDGAHNPHGVGALTESLRQYLPGRKLTFVMGVMADKDYDRMLDLVSPLAERFIVTAPDSGHALSSERLAAEIAARLGLPVRNAGTAAEGVQLALRDAKPEDAVCVFGSLYQVDEVRRCFGG